MTTIDRGQKLPLQDPQFSKAFPVSIEFDAPGTVFDVSCFGLDASEKLSDERYMVFFNQKASPENAVVLTASSDSGARFELDPSKLPASVDKLVFTASIDGSSTMGQIRSVRVQVGSDLELSLRGADFAQEKALMLVEVYRKGGLWRLNAVGQGFNGGLSALLAHFGGEEAAPAPAAPAAPAVSAARINLDKRIEREAPHLIDLTKKAQIVLEKRGLGTHKARCAICLDISASMDHLYTTGKVQALADRVMALATRFDDDGELDVFLFGELGHQPKPMAISGCSTYVRDLLREHSLEGGTRYHTAMKLIREHYFGSSDKRLSPAPKAESPVYVMFITDGGTSNRESAVNQVTWSSFEPLFWQFMGLGSADFEFLEKLDDLKGRLIDNADFFPVSDPAKLSDDELFSKMMAEYPAWVAQAKAKGLI